VDKKRAAEEAAAAASVRRLYRVREEAGVEATRTPDIIAPAVDVIPVGTAFYGKAEVRQSTAVVRVQIVAIFPTRHCGIVAQRSLAPLFHSCFLPLACHTHILAGFS